MKAAYKQLVKQRRKLRHHEVYWFNWAIRVRPAVRPGGPGSLTLPVRRPEQGGRACFTPLPILSTYTSLAAKYEGCRKTTDARRCR